MVLPPLHKQGFTPGSRMAEEAVQSSFEETVALVLDVGSTICRAGFSGEESPRTTFPTIIGRPPDTGGENVEVNFAVGEEARRKRDTQGFKLTCPLQRGAVSSWDDMENILSFAIYHELQAVPEEHPLLITEPPLSLRTNREKTAELIFEDFKSPALHLGNQGLMALFAANCTTGLSVSVGNGLTHVVPISDGIPLTHATIQLDYAGQDLTDLLMTMLTEQGHSFSRAVDREHVCAAKEELCYVAFDFDAELAAVQGGEEEVSKTHTLPDGTEITLKDERFRCPEVLFRQSVVGRDLYEGVHDMAHCAIAKCNMLLRRPLFENVVVSGGTTLLPGFCERLEKELHLKAPPSVHVKVASGKSGTARQHACWVGGAIYASLSTFDKVCIGREDYEEFGPSVMTRNTF